MSAPAPETSQAVRSMTGFGSGHAAGDGVTADAEARSVNARHLKVHWRLPNALESHASDLEHQLRERIERGTVTVSLRFDRERTALPATIDAEALRAYAAEVRDALGENREVELSALLRLPGVIVDAPEEAPTEAQLAVCVQALEAAFDALREMREREGTALTESLTASLDEVDALVAQIETRVPIALEEHRDRMRQRLADLLDGATNVPEELVAREIAVLTERSDVAEETERLRSHVAQWREALAAGGAIGRRLEFLSQEMGREANTIGSKSADAELRSAVVELKLIVDRLKEQAANVE